MKNYFSWTFGTLLMLGASGAQAQAVSFDAGFSNVNYGVIDLTPDDGVEASYTYSILASSYYLLVDTPAGIDLLNVKSASAAPVDYALSVPGAQAHAKASGVPGEQQVGGTGPYYHDGTAKANAIQTWVFTLAPNSALTFSAHAYQQVTGLLSSAIGTSAISIQMRDEDSGRYKSFSNEITTYSEPNLSYEADVWLAYANPTDRIATVTVEFATVVSVVPEPSTYAMLGVGLLALCAVARRRPHNA